VNLIQVSLQPLVNKEQVGVLGQAKDYVGVWGESIDKIGVVGSSGDKLAYTDLPNLNVGVYGTSSHWAGIGIYGESVGTGVHGYSEDNTGVFGESESGPGIWGASTSYIGIIGYSESTLPSNAGIRAVGNGASAPGSPNAAAIEIDNGAIRVDGDTLNRPAGTFTVPDVWTPIQSCQNGDPSHNHEIGEFTYYNLQNNLILADGSIILLTVEIPSYYGVFAQVVSKSNGSSLIKITAVGCSTMVGSAKVHYLIINPAPKIQ